MIREVSAIEMAIDSLDRNDKFKAGVYEKAREEYIDLRAEIAQLHEDLELAEAAVTELAGLLTRAQEEKDENCD